VRIGIATDDGTIVAAHTGRCAGVVVFDISAATASRRELRPNDLAPYLRGRCVAEPDGEASPGKEPHSRFARLLADCQVLITRGIGPRLREDLNRAGIEVHVVSEASVDRAARLYAAGRWGPTSGV